MQTIYDWLTLLIFTGLVVLMLDRSQRDPPPDKLWQYGPPAVGCAVANYLGNEGFGLPAVVVVVATLGYIYYVLKPFERK
jgi:hypothetical protein